MKNVWIMIIESWYYWAFKALALHALLCSTQKFVNNCVDKAMSTAEQSKGLEQGKLPRSAPFSISCFAQDETFKLQ